MQNDIPGRKEKLYTTAEIMLATGLQRGTIANRIFKPGYTRAGKGYTAEQVFRIITTPLQNHRKSGKQPQSFEKGRIIGCWKKAANGRWNIVVFVNTLDLDKCRALLMFPPRPLMALNI